MAARSCVTEKCQILHGIDDAPQEPKCSFSRTKNVNHKHKMPIKRSLKRTFQRTKLCTQRSSRSKDSALRSSEPKLDQARRIGGARWTELDEKLEAALHGQAPADTAAKEEL